MTKPITKSINIDTIKLVRELRRIESTTRHSRVRDFISGVIRAELQWRARRAQETLRVA